MEKISDAIKIKKADDIKENPSENIDKNSDDKSLYLKASELLKENKLKECVEILTKIKSEHEDIKIFIKNANERIKLNELFLKFKSEFISKNE